MKNLTEKESRSINGGRRPENLELGDLREVDYCRDFAFGIYHTRDITIYNSTTGATTWNGYIGLGSCENGSSGESSLGSFAMGGDSYNGGSGTIGNGVGNGGFGPRSHLLQ